MRNPIARINAELIEEYHPEGSIDAVATLDGPDGRLLAYAVPCEDEDGKVVGWQIWNAVTDEEAGGHSFIPAWRGHYGRVGLLPILRRYALKVATNRRLLAA